MIADLQSERMDEQRAMLPGLVNRRGVAANNFPANAPAPDDAFLDMLMRCQVIDFNDVVNIHKKKIIYIHRVRDLKNNDQNCP